MSDKRLRKSKKELLVEIDELKSSIEDQLIAENKEVFGEERNNYWNRWGIHPLDMNTKQLFEHIRLQKIERTYKIKEAMFDSEEELYEYIEENKLSVYKK